jgi:hypothetical protein
MDMNWIHLAQDGIQWRAVVITAMKIRVPRNCAKTGNGMDLSGLD